MASEIDLERAHGGAARGRAGARVGLPRGRRPGRRPSRAAARRSSGSGLPSGAIARARGTAGRSPLVADARPFHWEFQPDRCPGGVPGRGRPPAERHGPDQRLQERRAQAPRRRDADRRALPVHERPRDRGRPGHGRHARATSGSSVDHPGRQRLRGRLGRRRVAVRSARGGGQDAGQLHPPRTAPVAVRPGDHQQPGRRPDRTAAGQPPRRRHARARRGDRVPQRLLLRARRPAGCAADRGPLPVRVGHGHRERDPGRRRSPTATR